MPINAGTATFTQGSASVTFSGADFYTRGAIIGNILKRDGENAIYFLAATPTTNTSLTLTETYKGASGTDSFQIFTDFTSLGLALVTGETRDIYDLLRYDLSKINSLLVELNAPLYRYKVTSKYWSGAPVLNQSFGYTKPSCKGTVYKIGLGTDRSPPDAALTLGINIDSSQQTTLTLPGGSSYILSSALNLSFTDSNYLNYTWGAVPSLPGSDYFVDIIWYGENTLDTRIDFTRYWAGSLVGSGIIGRGFTFPVKSRIYALTFNYRDNFPDTGAILELLKNGASFTSPRLFTLSGQSGTVTTIFADFDVTDICTLRINSVGSPIAGSELDISLLSYRIL